MATSSAWRRFVRAQGTYQPHLEYPNAIGEALEGFEFSLLAKKTAIWSIRADRNKKQPQEDRLDDDGLSALLAQSVDDSPLYDFFFVNRLLRKSDVEHLPEDHYKLRISKQAFQLLISRCNLSASFIFALSRFYLPNGQYYGELTSPQHWAQWYFLSVRVQVPCSDKQRSHAMSTTGSSQMNPFHYLHLPNMEMDIRGSRIAIHVTHDVQKDATTVTSFNFMDGRWAKIVEEPQNRISEALRDPRTPQDPMFVHLVYLTSITRWWNNALHSVNEQLIAYEGTLQEERLTEDSAVNTIYSEGSKALHAMAAHIQRYGTELDALEDTAAEISKWSHGIQRPQSPLLASIEQIRSQLKATNAFVKEQEKKTQNILALVSVNPMLPVEKRSPQVQLFNRMQITNDRRMEAVLRSTQQEAAYSRQIAERSQELAEEMKRDSLSIRTIAIMTLFFLPAASFAAILAMPFFSDAEYLSNGTAVWIWVVLTVPTTAIAYAFYHFRRTQGVVRKP
ncbi:MAG: hypothetical protein Q9168_004211 [Polycauliona sp. 1 TL-2023]